MAISVLDGPSPRSRVTDPVTSVDAGRAADLNRSQSVVLAAMRARGAGLTQFELEQLLPGLSPSRVRSAVSELAEQGLVLCCRRNQDDTFRAPGPSLDHEMNDAGKILGHIVQTTPPSIPLDTLKALVLRTIDRLDYVIDRLSDTDCGVADDVLEVIDGIK